MALILTRDEYDHGVRGAAFLMKALDYRSLEQLELHLAGLDDEPLIELLVAALDATQRESRKMNRNGLTEAENELARRVYYRICDRMGARTYHPDELKSCLAGWSQESKERLFYRTLEEVRAEGEQQ